jgi:hypothetical protein
MVLQIAAEDISQLTDLGPRAGSGHADGVTEPDPVTPSGPRQVS